VVLLAVPPEVKVDTDCPRYGPSMWLRIFETRTMKKSCSACGFLTRKIDADAAGQQISLVDRNRWRINILTDGSAISENPSRPQCLLNEPFLQESLTRIDRPGSRDDVQSVLDRENECASFRVYLPGFDPKEHYQMMWHEQMRERDLAWQKSVLEWRQEIREKEDREIERRRKEDACEIDRRRKEDAERYEIQVEKDRKWRESCEWRNLVRTLIFGGIIGIGTGVAIKYLEPFVATSSQPANDPHQKSLRQANPAPGSDN
jgi:hypothetical protein